MKKLNLINKKFLLFLVLALLIHFNSSFASAQSKAPTEKPKAGEKSAPAVEKSLYERVGGVNSIAAVVDDFVDGLLVNPVITKNENVVAGLAHITKAGLKFHITELVCQAAGGPQMYTGKTMKESHKGLNISDSEWDAMVEVFKKSLAKFSVAEKDKTALIAIVATTKADIVTAKAPVEGKMAPEALAPAEQKIEKTAAARTIPEEGEPAPPPPGIPGPAGAAGIEGLPGVPAPEAAQ